MFCFATDPGLAFPQIVDLIRADLLSLCSPSSVHVPKLMCVESYATVHQLVTTVQGKLKEGISTTEALARCFPPGSMTGAPKKRSVSILEHIEAVGRSPALSPNSMEEDRSQRGVYSGVLGWLGIDSAADFSVVIRTAVVHGEGE
jgi:para-aminobenzoate synthetase